MKKKFYLVFLGGLLAGCSHKSVDLLVTNAQIYTASDQQPTAEAVAIRKGIFVAVGSTQDITKKYRAKKTWDAQGHAVFPGYTTHMLIL